MKPEGSLHLGIPLLSREAAGNGLSQWLSRLQRGRLWAGTPKLWSASDKSSGLHNRSVFIHSHSQGCLLPELCNPAQQFIFTGLAFPE